MAEFLIKPTKPVSTGIAIVCLVLNILISGIGSIVYGRVVRGILQFILAFVFIGWVWSLIDGIRIMMMAPKTDSAPMPAKNAGA